LETYLSEEEVLDVYRKMIRTWVSTRVGHWRSLGAKFRLRK